MLGKEYVFLVRQAAKRMKDSAPVVIMKAFGKEFVAYFVNEFEDIKIAWKENHSFIAKNPLFYDEPLLEFEDIFRIPDSLVGFDSPRGFWKPTKAYLPEVEAEGMTCFDLRNFDFKDMLVYGQDNEIIGRIINEGSILDRSKL